MGIHCNCDKTTTHNSCWTHNMCEKAANISEETLNTVKTVAIASACLVVADFAYNIYNGNPFRSTLVFDVSVTINFVARIADSYIKSAKACSHNTLRNRAQVVVA